MINNVIIAMGGVGKRFKCEEKNLSSKLFFQIHNKTLLEHILNNLSVIDLKKTRLIFLLTNRVQENDLDSIMKNYSFDYDKTFTKISDNIFSYLVENQNNLLIYGDTYFNVNVLDKLCENYLYSGLSQVVLLPTENGIDNVEFKITKQNFLKVKNGVQKFEVGQVLLFNKDVTNQILQISKKYNRFEILYKYIIPNNKVMAIKCINNEVVNINTESDLKNVH